VRLKADDFIAAVNTSISVGMSPSMVSLVSVDTAFDLPSGAGMVLDISPW
jgi:hypothetical protein